MQLRRASPATQPAKQQKILMIQIYLEETNIFSFFVETSFLIHATAHQNKLNMWHRKREMQIQTEHQMIWFEKL